MNPIKWVRWKVVIVLAAVCGALYFLGLNPLARRQLNDIGATGQAGARFSVEAVDLGLLQGRSSFNLFQLATPRKVPAEQEAKEQVAKADEIVFDLGMGDLLRKRFAIDEMSVTKPLLRIERREDGTINIGEIGTTEPEKAAGKPTDWLGAIKEWAEKLKKRVEERRKREAEEKQKEKEGKKPEVAKKEGAKADYTRQIAYPFENVPRVLIRKVSAKALEIQFEDRTGSLKPPPIQNGEITITNLTDRPEVLAEPLQIQIKGEIEGAPIEIGGTIDLRKIAETGVEKNDLLLTVRAKNVPLQTVVQAFAAKSLEFIFKKGTADLDCEVQLLDLDRLAVRSIEKDKPLFRLKDVDMEAKPGSKIAGLDGQQFAAAVNRVGTFEVKDLEIGGTLTNPEFKWGDSVKNFIISGGKAVAEKEGKKALEKGAQEAQKALDKALQKQSPETKKAIEGIIPQGGAEKALKEGGGGLLQGILGGKKKPEEKPAEGTPAPPEDK